MSSRIAELETALSRLLLIPRQDALFLLRSSLSHSKLLYSLRCTPCAEHPLLERFDATMREGLSNILNIELSDSQWRQATLPIRDGGLGIRRVAMLAPSAFLASAAGTRLLQSSMLEKVCPNTDAHEPQVRMQWSLMSQLPSPRSDSLGKQSTWDRPLIQREINHLFEVHQGQYHQARLRAVSTPHASDWLHALPITACGLRMDDETVRVVVGLRLGATICEKHLCPCGATVSEDGSHGLSCRLGPGRVPRHSMLNDLIQRALVRAGVPSIKEPPGLCRTDGKRPDGLTLIPWRTGRSLVWDATVADTVAPTHLPTTALAAGAAAESAAARKISKYQTLSFTHIFLPLAFETLGPINSDALDFFNELGRLIAHQSGDNREGSYLFQRISVIIQRFNAIAFRGTFPNLEPNES